MITLKQYAGSIVTPKDDALLYDFIAGATGFVSGCTVTHLGANQLKIAAGWGIIQGRCFAVEEETINANVSTSGTVSGRLLIQIDTSNTETPISFVTQAAATLPDLTQENINGAGNVYQLPIATYSVSELLISGLTDARSVITAISAAKTAEWTGIIGRPADGTLFTVNGNCTVDLNNLTAPGTFLVLNNVANAPWSTTWCTLVNMPGGTGAIWQMAANAGDGRVAIRHFDANTWTPWATIYSTQNITVSTAAPASLLPDGAMHMVYGG